MLSKTFHPEPPPDTKIWRYMDLPKFLSLVHTNTLFFSQVKKLEDTYEGSQRWIAPKSDFMNSDAPPFFSDHYNYVREITFVSCWHMNEYESTAMWKMYQFSNQGIAIQTTIKKLKESLLWDQFGRAWITPYTGMVNYRNTPFTAEEADSDGFLTDTASFFCKRPSFEHEKEYRIVIEGINSISEKTLEGGLAIPIETITLLENIFVAPTAPIWIRNLIESILKTKYDLVFEVQQSSLDERSLW